MERQITISINVSNNSPNWENLANSVLEDSFLLKSISALPNGTAINNITGLHSNESFGGNGKANLIIVDSDSEAIRARVVYDQLPSFKDLRDFVIYVAFSSPEDLNKQNLQINPKVPSAALPVSVGPINTIFGSKIVTAVLNAALAAGAIYAAIQIIPALINLIATSINSSNKKEDE